jgi:hypothetical protein
MDEHAIRELVDEVKRGRTKPWACAELKTV